MPFLLKILFTGVLVTIAVYLIWRMIPSRRDRPQAFRHCPNCGYDMRTTLNLCTECGWRRQIDLKGLLATAPREEIEPRPPEEHEEQIVVHETLLSLDAEILCEQLLLRGIHCHLQTRMANSVLGRLSDRVYHELVIWSGDLEGANAILDKARIKTEEAAPP